MTKPYKIMYGVLSIWSFVWTIVYYAIFFSKILGSVSSGGAINPEALAMPEWINWMITLTFWIGLGLLITFVMNASQNNRLSQVKKTTWVTLLIIFSTVVMPFYWYKYIWKE